MIAPLCPNDPAHGPMLHVVIAQGDTILGCAWFCSRNDEGKPEYCDAVRDCDCVDQAPDGQKL